MRCRTYPFPRPEHVHAQAQAEKAAKKRRKAEFQTVFIGGKMKRIRRPPTIYGMDVDEFIRRNADPIFLHEMGMWELMEQADAPAGPGDEEPDIF